MIYLIALQITYYRLGSSVCVLPVKIATIYIRKDSFWLGKNWSIIWEAAGSREIYGRE